MKRQFKTSLSEEGLSVSNIYSDDNKETLLTKSLSHTGSMFHLSQVRQKRKLPSNLSQNKRQLHRSFWPTYRGAVEWMRKREQDLNTLIGLLELYPQIIQETSLDGLWAWLYPLIHSHNTSKTESLQKKKEGSSHKSTSKNNKKADKPVPFISITTPSGEKRETVNTDDSQLVYVIGNTSLKDNSEKCIIDTIAQEIQRHFFTMVDTGYAPEEHLVLESCINLKRSRVVIFLVSDEALNCTTSVRLLRLAWRCNIPVIFVRNLAFSLPKPLPDVVFETFRGPPVPTRGNETVLDNRARSVSPSFANGSSPLHSRFNALRSPTPKKTYRAQSGKSSKNYTSEEKSIIALKVKDGYDNSLVYNETDRTAFTQQLFQKLSAYTGVVIHQQDKLEPNIELEKQPEAGINARVMRLRVPGSGGSVSGDDDSVIATSEYDSYDEGLDRVFDDDLENDDLFTAGMDSGLSSPMEKETTYVVYPSLEYSEPLGAPKIVRWPPKNNEICQHTREIDTFSPFFDSPLGFEDVNLGISFDSDSP